MYRIAYKTKYTYRVQHFQQIAFKISWIFSAIRHVSAMKVEITSPIHNIDIQRTWLITFNSFALIIFNKSFIMSHIFWDISRIIIIIIIIIIIMHLQPFVGPWPLFQFLDPIHSR
jgi:hypothetical protein